MSNAAVVAYEGCAEAVVGVERKALGAAATLFTCCRLCCWDFPGVVDLLAARVSRSVLTAGGIQPIVAEDARLGFATGSKERSACVCTSVARFSGISVSDWNRSWSAIKRPVQYAELWPLWISRGSVVSTAEFGSTCDEVDDADCELM